MEDGDISITEFLRRVRESDDDALSELLCATYHKLREIAHGQMRGQPPEHTLQPTALVNEVVLRLLRGSNVCWSDPNHYYKWASLAMRQILVDYAKAKKRKKRTAPGTRVSLEDVVAAHERRVGDLEVLNEALDRFEDLSPIGAKLIELRFFLALPMEEAARALDLPLRTAQREWTSAKKFLAQELQRDA